jgi:hypothetical protein
VSILKGERVAEDRVHDLITEWLTLVPSGMQASVKEMRDKIQEVRGVHSDLPSAGAIRARLSTSDRYTGQLTYYSDSTGHYVRKN